MATGEGLRAREAQIAERAARLLGLDPQRAGVVNLTVDDPTGPAPVLRVDVIVTITPEEALRLRYGDDAVIERTDRGFTVSFNDEQEAPRA